MPVVLRHHQQLELNRVEYSGSITLAELRALAEFNAADQTWLTYDCLNIIQAGADFRTVAPAELDAVFLRYRALYAPMNFLIMRRSAWLCESPAAQAHLDHWLGGHDIKNSMSTDVRQFDNFDEAGEWLVLSPPAKAALLSGQDFADIVRFNIPAPRLAR